MRRLQRGERTIQVQVSDRQKIATDDAFKSVKMARKQESEREFRR